MCGEGIGDDKIAFFNKRGAHSAQRFTWAMRLFYFEVLIGKL